MCDLVCIRKYRLCTTRLTKTTITSSRYIVSLMLAGTVRVTITTIESNRLVMLVAKRNINKSQENKQI